jgi:hypothetical protein
MSEKAVSNETHVVDDCGLFSCNITVDGQTCKAVKVDSYAIPDKEASTEAWITVEPGKVGRMGSASLAAADFEGCLSEFSSVFRCLKLLRG